MRSDRLRLLDAIEQIELISSFSTRGRDVFPGRDASERSAAPSGVVG